MMRAWVQILPLVIIKWYARKWIPRHEVEHGSYLWCRAFEDVVIRCEDVRLIGKVTKRTWWCGNGDHDHHDTRKSAQRCIDDRLRREEEAEAERKRWKGEK